MKNKDKYTFDKDNNITHKICTNCDENKSLEDFSILKTNKTDGRNSICKKCRSEKAKTKNNKAMTSGTKACSNCKETLDISKFSKYKASQDGIQSACKSCQHQRMKLYTSTLDGYINRLFLSVKHNTIKRAKDLDVQITSQDIIDLHNKQNGKCALTNIKMTHIAYNTQDDQHTINKYNISIDRIDSNKGYTTDNIQLVCAIINRIKSDIDDVEFLLIVNKLSTCDTNKINKFKSYHI